MNPCLSKKIVRAAITLLVAASVSAQVFAGGFSIYEQGARATAMGGAMVARPWDASAAFYNPAGLAAFGTTGQWRIYGGVVPVQTMGKFSGLNPSPGVGIQDKQKSSVFFPFNLYAAYQIKDNMAFALAVTTPFGLGTEWENPGNTYSGRFRSVLGNIQAVYLSPTFSYKINDMFSAGVGIDYVFSKVKLKRNISQTISADRVYVYDAARVTLNGTDHGSFGFHLGLLAKVNDQVSVGVDYKHSIKNTYDGEARFRQINHAKTSSDTLGNRVVDPAVATKFADPLFGGLLQDGNTSVTFPNSLVIGVGYKPTEKLSVEADFAYVGWKKFDKVQINFPEQLQPGAAPSILEENYKNSWQIRLGGEYWFTDKFAGRLGYIYDKTPAPTATINPLLPDASRNDFGIGFGYKVSDEIHIDIAYLAVFFKERSTKGTNLDGYDGIYNSHVNLYSMSFGYTFGGK